MKRFVIILLAVVLLLGCIVGYAVAKNAAQSGASPVPAAGTAPDAGNAPDATTAPAAEPVTVRKLDYETIYALHEPDEIVGHVAGRGVTWDEFFYWLHTEGADVEQELDMLAYYGQSLDWGDKLSSDSDLTLADYVLERTKGDAQQLNVIEAIAEENGVTLTEENEAELAELRRQTIESICGEGASEEEFNALLEREMVSRAMFDRLDRANYLYRNIFIEQYGLSGEKVPEETALDYLRGGNYLCAGHILFATVDFNTLQPLDEETAAQKKQQAEAVSAELRAIADPAARAARFAELKEQYCDDEDGKTYFPEGYLFPAGVDAMAAEFEAGVKALQEYEVSEPVKTVYGYHVILRLPLSADMTMQYSEADTPLDARAVWANEQFSAMMNSRMEQGAFEPADGFALDLTQYLK